MAVTPARSGILSNTAAVTSTIITVVVNAGDTVTVVVCFNNTTGTASGIVDSSGTNVYTQKKRSNTNRGVEIWTCLNAGASATTITISHTSNRTLCYADIFTGVDSIGLTAAAAATSTAPAASITIQDANNYVVTGVAVASAVTVTAATGTVRRTSNYGGGTQLGGAVMDHTVASGACTPTGTITSAAWDAVSVELRNPATLSTFVPAARQFSEASLR